MATTIKLDPALEERYKSLANKTGRSQSFYMRQALENEIDHLEWVFGIWQDVEEIRAGKQETDSLDKVMEEYGL